MILEKRTFNNRANILLTILMMMMALFIYDYRNNDGFTLLTDTDDKLIVLERVFYKGVTGNLGWFREKLKKKRKDSKILQIIMMLTLMVKF